MRISPCVVVMLLFAVSLADTRAAAPTSGLPTARPQARTRVVFSAIVNPNGAQTAVTFRYGTTVAYGMTTEPKTIAIGASTNVTATATDVEHGKTYHFQVVATNGDGSFSSIDQTFVQNVAPVAVADTARVRADQTGKKLINVTANDSDADSDMLAVTSVGAAAHGVTAIEGNRVSYTPGPTFKRSDSFTYMISDGVGGTATATVSVINSLPQPQPDSAFAMGAGTINIDALKNDSDPDGDPLRIVAVQNGQRGRTAIVGQSIRYTPGPGFIGSDTFTYSVSDGEEGTVTARVTIGWLPQTFGAVVTDREGKAVGSLRLDGLRTGAFTGRIQIEQKFYRIVGRFDSQQRFRGEARDEDGSILPVTLRIVQDGGVTTLKAELGDGELTASQASRTLTDAGLAGLKGRYTVELPAPGASTAPTAATEGTTVTGESDDSGPVPAGTGWMSIKIDQEGNARIKGKAGDGRGFSAHAVIGGSDDAPVLPVFITPDGARLSGTLTFGDIIGGEMVWTREASDASYFPEGFSATVAAQGGRYEPPAKDQHALVSAGESGRTGSITISEGEVPGFTRDLRFSRRDNIRVTDRGEDRIDIDIDRKSGTFKGKFRILSDLGRRVKFSGVLLQGEGRGSGVFLGVRKSGKVELAITDGATTQTDSGTPDDGTDNELVDDLLTQ